MFDDTKKEGGGLLTKQTIESPKHVNVTYPIIGENLVAPACSSSGLQIIIFSPYIRQTN